MTIDESNGAQETEYMAYHKVKRKFISLDNIDLDNEDIEIYEFKDQNFRLVTE